MLLIYDGFCDKPGKTVIICVSFREFHQNTVMD